MSSVMRTMGTTAMPADQPQRDDSLASSDAADGLGSDGLAPAADAPATFGTSPKDGTVIGSHSATDDVMSLELDLEAALGESDADLFQLGRRLGPAVQCAVLMLRTALKTRTGFVRRAMEPTTISVLEVPDPSWGAELLSAWNLVSDATGAEDRCCAEDAVAEAAQRRLDRSRQGKTSWNRRGQSDLRVILAFDRKMMGDASSRFRDAVSECRPVLGVSHQPEALLPADLLLAEDQRLTIGPPDAIVLASLATVLTSQDGKPADQLPHVPPKLAEAACAVTPVLAILARRPGQTPDAYLKRLTELVARQEAAAAQKRDRSVVTLDDLPGLGEAMEWGRSAAADLRAYADGTLPWSELDRGVVLEGPPGCGKSTFARALANTAGVAFVSGSLAQWQGDREGHLGHLLGAMRQTFDLARREAPCVLLIDEIDSFPARSSVTHSHRDYVIEVVNALLEQLDGAVERTGVLVIGTCNDAGNLDPALTRAGRLEQAVRLRRPNAEALIRIFRIHLTGLLSEVDLGPLAAAAEAQKAVGADVERWCRNGRRRARGERRDLCLQDLVEEVGDPPPVRDAATLFRIAVHEAGHALGFAMIGPEFLRCVTLGRTSANGDFTTFDLKALATGRPLLTRTVTQEILTALLAGRAAEEAILGEPSAGAGGSPISDLAMATRLACLIVGTYGLDDHPEALIYRGSPERFERSDGLLDDASIRARVAAVLGRCHQDALALVLKHQEGVMRVAGALVERRVVEADEALALLGPLHDGAGENQPSPTPHANAVGEEGAP
jgi:cell division protease FtsH